MIFIGIHNPQADLPLFFSQQSKQKIIPPFIKREWHFPFQLRTVLNKFLVRSIDGGSAMLDGDKSSKEQIVAALRIVNTATV